MTRRKKPPVRHIQKPKILLDEGLPPRVRFTNLNSYFDVKHIKFDLKKGGVTDEEVYLIAKQQARLLITLNIKDFKPRVSSNNPSIIGVSARLTVKAMDQKLTKLLKSLKPKDFVGGYFEITGESK